MQQRRNTHAGRGEKRRHCRIAAEADDGNRLQARHQLARRAKTGPERGKRLDNADRVLRTDRRRRHDVNFVCRKFARIALGTAVGHQMHGVTARLQLIGKCLCRKNMAAGSTGGKQNDTLAHHSFTPQEDPRRRGRSCAPVRASRACVVSAPAGSQPSRISPSSKNRHRKSAAASCPWPA